MNPPPMTTADLVVEDVDLTTTVMMFFYVWPRVVWMMMMVIFCALQWGLSLMVLLKCQRKQRRKKKERERVINGVGMVSCSIIGHMYCSLPAFIVIYYVLFSLFLLSFSLSVVVAHHTTHTHTGLINL